MSANKRQRILIVGGGFAGLRALFHLSRIDGLEIIVLDPRETSLVKPALPEVALSGKSVENVAFRSSPSFAALALVSSGRAWTESLLRNAVSCSATEQPWSTTIC